MSTPEGMSELVLYLFLLSMKRNSSNHYAIVSFRPKRLTDKVIILFQNGKNWSTNDKNSCIQEFMYAQQLLIEEVHLTPDWEECEELRCVDDFVDVVTFRNHEKLF